MPFYRYQALNSQGSTVKGTLEAASINDAKDILRGKKLMPTAIALAVAYQEEGFSFGQLFQRGVDEKSVLVFTKQLGVLLSSGVPLLNAIELLSHQFTGKFRQILVSIKDDLSSGKSFAYALSKYPKQFSSVYVQLVRAGEASGKLENIMERLFTYMEGEADIRKRTKKALAYPIFMISFSIVLTLGLIVGLVPMFGGIFKELGVTPPPITQNLQAISTFLQQYWLLIITVLLGGVIFAWFFFTREAGKRWLDYMSIKFPLTAYFARTSAVVQFSKTLGMLLASGVNLAEALDIVCNIVNNSVLVDALKAARDNIIKEGKITYYLRQTNIFPPIALYMIETGEQSGELASMLLNVGHDYEVELRDLIDSIISKINPVMLFIIGGVVVLMIGGIFLPLFDAMNEVQKRV